MSNDIHVKILRFAKEQPNGIFKLQTIFDRFPEHRELIDRECQNNRLFASIDKKWGPEHQFSLSFEDYFRLIEHQELDEARKSARFAFCVAIASITLNICALLYAALGTANVRIVNWDEQSYSKTATHLLLPYQIAKWESGLQKQFR